MTTDNDEAKRLALTKMFEHMFDMIGDDVIDANIFNEELHIFLDRLMEDDYFGTEGQLDPRAQGSM